MGERAHCSTDLAHTHSFARPLQTLSVAAHLGVPKSEGQSKRSWFGVNAMRASYLRGVFEFERAFLQHLEECVHLL
jgi:hypothetical protein